MNITIEWVNEDGAYIVRQDGEFIGDFEELLPAAEFGLAVVHGYAGARVELVSVNPNA